jgi:hypothetical protein
MKYFALKTTAAIFCLLAFNNCLQRRGNVGQGSYSDSDLRSIKGVQISTTGYETVFRIPFSQALASDRRILFRRLTQTYVESLELLKKDYLENKVNLKR